MYKLQSQAENANGCISLGETRLIVGHYATFWTNDSIACVGDTVRFDHKIRYFTTECPLPLEECLNEIDTFWDGDPIFLRKLKNPSWKRSAGFTQEFAVQWDVDGDNKSDVMLYDKKNKPYYIYKKPGVYDITMFTNDSNDCYLNTRRRKLVKVISVDADFAVKPEGDTLLYCAPQFAQFADRTHIEPSLPGDFKLSRKYAAYTDRVVKRFPANPPFHLFPYDSIILDTIIVDSVISRTWNPGDGRPSVVRTDPNDTLLTFEYINNGEYDVSLKVRTAQGCTDEELKYPNDPKGYIEVVGPPAQFQLLDSVGCVPLTVRVKVLNITANNYNWVKSDGTTESHASDSFRQGSDSIVTLTFNKPGKFTFQLIESDSAINKLTGTFTNCIGIWPDTVLNPSLPRFHVTVFPQGELRVNGPDTICLNTEAEFSPITDSAGYQNYAYSFGDGATMGTTSNSPVRHAYTTTGYKRVTLVGQNKYELYGKDYTCDNIAIKDIYVEGIKASFEVDSSMANQAKFTLVNTTDTGVRFIWQFKNSSGQKLSDDIEKFDTIPFVYDAFNAIPKEPREYNPAVINQPADNYSFDVCLIAFSQNGCPDTVCRPIQLKRVWEPFNVITPNGDGVNDVFDLRAEGQIEYKVTIYNRWGSKVFESNDKTNDWNGKNMNDGTDVPAGVYYYVWEFQLIGLDPQSHMGTVTVIR